MDPERNREVSDVDAFEEYFKRADLNQDGKISHEEALLFFEGSNLPRHTFDEIWVFADHRCEGFLGREEFYDALKLASVAQQRERGETLYDYVADETLCSPASANIPPPHIIALPPDHIGWGRTPIPPPSSPSYSLVMPEERILPNGDKVIYRPNPPPGYGISAPSPVDHPQPCNALLGCKAIHSHHTPPPASSLYESAEPGLSTTTPTYSVASPPSP